MFSGGLSSAFVLNYIIEKFGRENTVALHTDTKWEDLDNYRFMNQVIKHLASHYIQLADGRIPPQVWFDERLLIRGNVAKCSLVLKTTQTKKYIKELRGQGIEPILYFWIGKPEQHRAVNIDYRYDDVECQFPLIDNYLTNEHMTYVCESKWKIKTPIMYKLGFSHANCGGRCIKGGHKHFRLLHNVWPERYAEVEEYEKEFRKLINQKIAILKDRRGGQVRYMTLEEFRKNNTTTENYAIEQNLVPCECI